MQKVTKAITGMALLGMLTGCGDGVNIAGPSLTIPGPDITAPGPNAGGDGQITGSGTLATDSRPVAGFSSVSLSGVGNLVIEQNGAESLEITADDNILPLLTSEVRGGHLHLGTAEGTSFASTTEITFRVSVRHLTELSMSGVGHAQAVGLHTERLSILMDGVSSVEAEGKVDFQDVEINGAGRYLASDLLSRHARVSLDGVGTALLHVSERLDARVAGPGVVEYYGDPVVTADTSDGGTVRPAGQ